ncbi:ExeM/NucH family extracellular endonuclease [Aestuariibius sp. 2305UL40-4]|uniref:ExeM/NucH family extracellular endonuclease n=1 Tax=Aestuariibius violaceus TaxID=3234132 RepID=UPI00345E576C
MAFGFFNRSFVIGSFGDDEIFGSARRDVVFALGGDDLIDTGDGNDLIFAGFGDDTILAGAGDDDIYGGFGFDTAVFSGAFLDYEVEEGGWFGSVVTVNGTDGADTLVGVEALQFDDYTLFLDGRNNDVIGVDDAVAAGEDGAVFAAADLVANDVDPDGDTLTVTGVSAVSDAGASVTLDGDQVSYDPGDLFDALGEGETATDTFTYTVEDGNGGSDTVTVSVTVTGTNDAPVLTLPSDVSVEENTTAVATATASDAEGDAVSFTLGGVDAALFVIDPETGKISFADAPDFEAPGDADGDNVYDLTVTADDGNGGTTTEAVSVTVTDVDENVREVVAFDLVDSESQRLSDFTGGIDFSSAGDGFGVFQVGVSDTIPFSLLDDSNNGFANDSLGIIDSAVNTEAFFGITDTQNADNDGPVSATWTFDISGFEDLSLSLDVGAMGDFESNDTFEITYTIDGGEAVTAFSFVVNEDGSQTYTLADGDTFTLDDPLTEENSGIVLSNVLQTVTTEIEGTGSDLALTVTAQTDGGSEAFAIQNIVIEGESDGSTGDETEFSVAAVTGDQPEGDSGVTVFAFEVTRSGDVSEPGSVAYSIGGDVDADDFGGVLPSGVVTFAAGETSQIVTVEVTGDLDPEADEALTVQLSDPEGGAIATGSATSIVENDDATLISTIQGSGLESELQGQAVTVEAVVTYVGEDGFYVQEEAADSDGDDATSEGIFVFTGSNSNPAVMVGQTVTVSGTVSEFGNQTQISNVTDLELGEMAPALPDAVTVSVGPDTVAQTDYESVEGMRVEIVSGTDEALTVIENFNLDRFGEISVSAGTQTQPTQLFDAQTQQDEVDALQEANLNNRLIIDDGDFGQNPTEFAYIPNNSPGDDGDGILDAEDNFDAGGTLRLGTEVTAPIEGIMAEAFGDYRVWATETMEIDESTNGGARPETPDDVGGSLQAVSFNVLNYFTTLDVSGNGTGPDGTLDPRGARTEEDLARQTESLVNALDATGGDVFAIQEVENNGFGEDSAIAALTQALDDANPETDMRFVDPTDPSDPGEDGFIGTDAITTGIIYDANKLTLVEADYLVFEEPSAADTFEIAERLNPYVPAGDQLEDFQRSRPATVATFEDNETGETFTVVSVHHKSKGDSGLEDLAEAVQDALDAGTIPEEDRAQVEADLAALLSDPNYDQGDGQAFWNAARDDASAELVEWLETEYTGDSENVLILGDFNAYAQEDPTQTVRDADLDDDGTADYVDLIGTFVPGGQADAFSFVFDGQQGTLDQGFASEELAAFVTGATEWHINAQEPDLLNYNSAFNDPGFYSGDVFAASDHDPLIVGIDFGAPDTLM